MALTPKDIFEIADRYCDSALLQHAHSAEVFELLHEPRTSFEVATMKGWLEGKTAILLDALVALELLEKDGCIYRNVAIVDSVLVRKQPGYIGDLIEHERLQWNLWGRIDEVLRSNHAVTGQQDVEFPLNHYANAVFQRAMMQLAGDLTDVVADLSEWAGIRYALDLAGGHGLYLCEVAKRHDSVSGEVWDAISAKSHALAVIEKNGLTDRIQFKNRDIGDPRSYEGVIADGMMLHHCLHHFDWKRVKLIAQCVARVIPSGGLITILNPHLEHNRTQPIENALFSLYMMMNSIQGQVHPTNDIVELFQEVGFTLQTTIKPCLGVDVLIVGTKR